MRKINSKKIILSLAAVVVLSIGLTGCGNTETKAPVADKQTQSTVTPQATSSEPKPLITPASEPSQSPNPDTTLMQTTNPTPPPTPYSEQFLPDASAGCGH
ncbi:MAG: hypothetical protein ACRKFN_12135 [Desulfitobacterium sp.]